MAESIFVRVQNILSAGADTAVSSVERASGVSLMREAIRQVERTEDATRDAIDAAKARRLHAERQQRAVREQAATLEEHARFALSKDRGDLAEAAIARQLDCEKHVGQLERSAAEANDEAARLEECLVALRTRKAQMQQELAAFEAVRRQSAAEGAACGTGSVERRLSRAETLFERAMAAAGGADHGLTPAGDAAKLVEVEALRKEAAVAERIAAMRTAQAAPAPVAKPRSRAR